MSPVMSTQGKQNNAATGTRTAQKPSIRIVRIIALCFQCRIAKRRAGLFAVVRAKANRGAGRWSALGFRVSIASDTGRHLAERVNATSPPARGLRSEFQTADPPADH